MIKIKDSHGTKWETRQSIDPVSCGELRLPTCYQDIHNDTGQINFWALRCVVCGGVIDPVILKNRRWAPAPNLYDGTKRREYGQRTVPIESTHERTFDVSDDERSRL